MQGFIEKYHPDEEVADHAVNLFNDNAVFHFRQILKHRQNQTSLGRFLVRSGSMNLKQVLGEQIQKRESSPEEQRPDVLMEGDSSSKQDHPSIFSQQ